MITIKKGIKQGASLAFGCGIGIAVVLRMDDIMYSSLRRHLIAPIAMIFVSNKKIESSEIIELGSGFTQFAYQFKPNALKQ